MLVLRVQFLDVKTTLDRWKEEVELVKMELVRTADYFRWMSGVWNRRALSSFIRGERAHASLMTLTYARLEEKVRARMR
jgi:hypothetical protein